MTLIQAQQRYIDRVTQCHPGHIRRVIRSAKRELIQWATARNLDAITIVRDADDMRKLVEASDD